MKNFLSRLRLIDKMVTEVSVPRDQFAKKFRSLVDEGSLDVIFSTFEAFDSSKNEYKGHVGIADFKIRRRRKLFDTRGGLAIATGTFRENGNELVIETEVSAMTGFLIFFYSIALLVYLGFIIAIVSGVSDNFVFLPFIILHAAFMLGIPYFVMRRAVKTMKYDLERELHYIASVVERRS
ncbi:MAG: hypothetical protein U0U09_05130 [Cyclobacteriaceae bacterium]